MKKLIILLLVFSLASAQSLIAQNLMQEAEAVVMLKMKGDNGNNGTAVVYNPKKEFYYAAFAGNTNFPLEVFNKYGKHLYKTITGFDVRGLWFNPKDDRIEGNAFDGVGLYYNTLDANGYPGDFATPILENIELPSSNSVGVGNSRKKEIYYLQNKEIKIYSAKDHAFKKQISLEIPYSSRDINTSTLLFTNVKNMEFGLLDVENKLLLLFNKKGAYKGSVSINASFSLPDRFNISFANEYLFIFNKNMREWTGYKVFK